MAWESSPASVGGEDSPTEARGILPAALPRAHDTSWHGTRKLATEAGYTLLEMLMVVTLLGVIAAIAVPSVSPADHQKLDLAASQVADAFRFAREESRLTGTVHGVAMDLIANRVRVFRLDETPNPNAKVFDVHQPISKQRYTLELGAPPYGGVTLDAVGGQMVGTCDDPGNIAFDAGGVVRCVEPVATRILDANVVLALADLTRTIAVASHTGRVSIQ